MIKSVSPNDGKAFANWSSASDFEISETLVRLSIGTNRLAADLNLRSDVLNTAIKALEEASEELVEQIQKEVGKTPAEANDEIPYALSFLQVALNLVNNYHFQVRKNKRVISEVSRGVGLLISPYNDPLAGLTRKIAPCLAAGAAAIVKPSELGVQCALTLKRIFSDAGLDQYISILPIAEYDRITKLMAVEEIGTVSFTGSSEVGLSLAAKASAAGKGFVGELGGTNPFVLMEDADLDCAIPDLISRKIKAAGQACSSFNIVFAERNIVDEVSERTVSALSKVVFGPSNYSVQMGPVRTSDMVKRLDALGTEIISEQGKLLYRGKQQISDGFIAPPAAYQVPSPGLLASTEIFGPLFGICAFDEFKNLRASLSANRQPLVLYVYGQNKAKIDELLYGLRYGSIGVNTTAIQGPEVPTGGFGQAGIGREGGVWGMREFLTTINRVEE